MPNRTVNEIGHAVRAMRDRRCMTQKELADKMTVLSGEVYTSSHISKWERGEHQLTMHDAGILADALDCSLVAFLSSSAAGQDDWLTAEERDIMLYGVSEWVGDIHAAIHLLNMYMTLPPDRRSFIINALLAEYEQANKACELIEGTVPVNKSFIVKMWREL